MTKGTILIVDDEEKLRSLLRRIIALEGFKIVEADSLKSAMKSLDKEAVDVVLCDVKLPDGNGVAFTRIIKEKFPATEIILLTAFGNIPDGVEAMKSGAFNYITKGDDNARIIPLLHQAVEKKQMRDRIEQLEQQVGKKYSFENILGSSPLLKEAIGLARIVAPNATTVLLLGETGTGKEVFAQAIHNAGKRSQKSFVALNCSSFSKELMESEIFGYKAGAFTNAVRDKKGLMEEADKGTLFLDEIGEMPVGLQSKLLRVLETGEYIKLGDTKTTRADVRIIAATNRDLEKDVKEGKFREDLFYRLNVYTITLPSLRDRKKDIPALAFFFVKLFSEKINVRANGMSTEFLEKLQQHDWKGNIRELKNVIERAVIIANGSQLDVIHLPSELRETQLRQHALSAFDLSSVEKLHIQRVLIHTGHNKAEAARLLNIGLATLYRKLDDYQIH
ncbi:MAG: sigma-54-dependent Fis family transcriptional regulator [Chitinophagaceae bacterium]|nr:sigma-54-dependent Fis family transcriptional regulator [Chitinophagaceae bacterium]